MPLWLSWQGWTSASRGVWSSSTGGQSWASPLPCRRSVAASLLGGWWWGYHSETVYVQRAVDALPAAAIRYGAVGAPQWLTLMTNNDITAAHRDCRAVTGGGEACSYDLWSRLPQVPTR